MKPINFKEANEIFAENQKDYLPLPAFIDPNDPKGQVICCWKLTFKERLKLLFSGIIWCGLLSFRRPLTPHFLTIDYPFEEQK